MDSDLFQELFDCDPADLDTASAEWQDMPEFVQEELPPPYSTIIIRCETKADLEDLSRRLEQKLTDKTKSIWHPFKSHWGNNQEVYIDEIIE